MPCFVYENTLNPENSNYLKLQFEATESNHFGIGAQITLSAADQQFYYENVPTRGFQSSMDFRPNIGVGTAKSVDVKVVWPSGKVSRLSNISTNQTLVLKEAEAIEEAVAQKSKEILFQQTESPLQYVKKENNYIDFNRERLIYQMRSNEGGEIGKGDINGDGLEDLVFPGAKGEVTQIFLNRGNQFEAQAPNPDLLKIKEAEHIQSLLFDADGDGDLDMYLASGGVELTKYSEYFFDYLFLNDGNGNFSLKSNRLPHPNHKISTGVVRHADIDQDGDEDLLVGERVKVGSFGATCGAFLLLNDGKGNFTEKTAEFCPALKEVGMVTDAAFRDINQDGQLDLVVVGEFMDIQLFVGNNGKLVPTPIKANVGLKGWWNKLQLFDADGDGDLDIIAGNLGENSRFKASEEHPIRLYYADFDANGMAEGVLSFNAENGKDYPYALRHNLLGQIKMLQKRYPNFESFKKADIQTIFTPEELARATVLETNQLNTTLLINQGDFQFESVALPTDVQLSPVYAIATHDFDADGDEDILLGGNQFYVLPEMGIYDGSYGQYLENKGNNEFELNKNSGFHVKGEIRDLVVLENSILVNRSRDTLLTFNF